MSRRGAPGATSWPRSTPPGPSRPVLLGLPQRRGVDQARGDGVHRDPLGPEGQGQGAGHGDDGALGGGVVHLEHAAGLRAGRGDVHDAAPAGLDHVGGHRLAAVEGADDVDGDDPLEGLPLDLQELLEGRDARVVDQDRRRPELLADGGDALVDLGPFADVDGQAQRPGTRRLDAGRRGRRGVTVPVEDGDRGAVGCQPLADGEPDPRRATGDDGGPGSRPRGGDGHRWLRSWGGTGPGSR